MNKMYRLEIWDSENEFFDHEGVMVRGIFLFDDDLETLKAHTYGYDGFRWSILERLDDGSLTPVENNG